MTEKEYNEAEGIRRSDLWKMEDSAEKFKYFLEHPMEQTPSMAFGSACHKMILEPETFGNEYAIAPDINRRTNAGKAEWEAFCSDNEGKTIISQDDANIMADMEEALEQCRLAKWLIRYGQHGIPIFWTDPETGEKCKAKLDVLTKDQEDKYIVIDYKTATSARTEKFNKSIFGFGYDLQAAMYTEGVQIALGLDYRPQFAFVVQEKKPPYAVNVVGVSPEVMEHGDKLYHMLMDKYHTCKELDEWNGYLPVDGGMNWTDLPAWVEFDEEDE